MSDEREVLTLGGFGIAGRDLAQQVVDSWITFPWSALLPVTRGA